MAAIFAVFSAGDAAVLVALISAFAAIVGPVVLLVVSSLRRIRLAAEQAVHNTQPNGVPDAEGNVGPPSAYDNLVASHEYMIGQIHAVARQAEQAARAADRARVAAAATDAKADALRLTVDTGFSQAKTERDAISKRLDRNIENGATFAEAILGGALDFAGRLDALDGKNSQAELRARIEGSETTPTDEA